MTNIIDIFIFVSCIWAWAAGALSTMFSAPYLMPTPRESLLVRPRVFHPERRGVQRRVLVMSTGHHHKAVPYVAAIVGAILAVVCLIAWALN